jgi:hypothetical protein
MGLDIKKLKSAKFVDRTKEIPIPLEMIKAAGWKKGTKWTIKALPGEALYSVRASVERNKNIEELVQKLVSGSVKEKVDAALGTLGLGDELPDDYVRRLNILRLGSKDPEIDHEFAKFVALNFPTFFNMATDEIQVLTGQGRSLGESSPSGQTQKYGQALLCAQGGGSGERRDFYSKHVPIFFRRDF